MSAVIVGGTPIAVAPNGQKIEQHDATDRSRQFDNSYKVSITGSVKHDYHFVTPPVPYATADSYETVLRVVTGQLCSGDIINGNVTCCAEIIDRTPIYTKQGLYAVIQFVLHEV